VGGAALRSALLRTGFAVPEEPVLTPRDKDLKPGTWTRGSPPKGSLERPAFRAPYEWREMAFAKFKYVGTQRVWRLYCSRSNWNLLGVV
jgi:hypothetical protein